MTLNEIVNQTAIICYYHVVTNDLEIKVFVNFDHPEVRENLKKGNPVSVIAITDYDDEMNVFSLHFDGDNEDELDFHNVEALFVEPE